MPENDGPPDDDSKPAPMPGSPPENDDRDSKPAPKLWIPGDPLQPIEAQAAESHLRGTTSVVAVDHLIGGQRHLTSAGEDHERAGRAVADDREAGR